MMGGETPHQEVSTGIFPVTAASSSPIPVTRAHDSLPDLLLTHNGARRTSQHHAYSQRQKTRRSRPAWYDAAYVTRIRISANLDTDEYDKEHGIEEFLVIGPLPKRDWGVKAFEGVADNDLRCEAVCKKWWIHMDEIAIRDGLPYGILKARFWDITANPESTIEDDLNSEFSWGKFRSSEITEAEYPYGLAERGDLTNNDLRTNHLSHESPPRRISLPGLGDLEIGWLSPACEDDTDLTTDLAVATTTHKLVSNALCLGRLYISVLLN
jgi:hypothetical protein